MILTLLSPSAWAKDATSVYVCAHPDDCVLFMNPNLYDDIAEGSGKVVMLYLTSGDGGEAFSISGSSYPYVREMAAIEATEWAADINAKTPWPHRRRQIVKFGRHTAERVSYANTVSYFLRLPDGDMYGEGFTHNRHASMKKLKDGTIARLATVDRKNSYRGWKELVGTLGAIIAQETQPGETVALHLSQTDGDANPGDHADHLAGAAAMLSAIEGDRSGRCYRLYEHLDYVVAEMPPNLEGADLQNKIGSFAVISATQSRFLTEESHWDKKHLPFLPRNYFTTRTIPAACGQ